MLVQSFRRIVCPLITSRLVLRHLFFSSNNLMKMETSIRNKLNRQFAPTHLEILNESYMHNVPKGSETHFKVVIISNNFENTSLLQRHRLVNEILQEELKNGVHALSIVAKTPSQWENSTKVTEKSPACKGGFGK